MVKFHHFNSVFALLRQDKSARQGPALLCVVAMKAKPDTLGAALSLQGRFYFA
jgi:hypothetical protein